MTILPLADFDSLMQTSAAELQSSATNASIDLEVGTVSRAILQAGVGNTVWLQYVCLQLLQATRLSTSTGNDIDSFVADFGLQRLPATSATGNVLIGRVVPQSTALIPLGTIVRTSDLSQSFSVYEDDTNIYWNSTLQGYQIPSTIQSISVPVIATVPGTAGNVQANTVTAFGTAIVGNIDNVNNPNLFTGGINPESDSQLQSRFVMYLQSLSQGTYEAIQYAVLSTQQGITCDIIRWKDEEGNWKPGNFIIYIDDGSGNPSSTLITNVYNNIDLAVRSCGETFAVHGPAVTAVNIAITLTIANGANKAILSSEVQTAVSAYVNSLSVGQILPFSKISSITYAVDPTITNVNVTINGGIADIIPSSSGVVKIASVTIS